MKTLILFAHYDPGSIIDPHVLRYVKQLRALGNTTLIFVSDVDPRHPVIHENSLAQLVPLIDAFHSEHTPSRDFGSWRIAWDIAEHKKLLTTADRVVFVNDSVYGGLFPLTEMWDTFIGCDMYGAIETEAGGAHLETFFVAFDLNNTTRAFLNQFWTEFEFVGDMNDLVVRYEIVLAKLAHDAGLTARPFVSARTVAQSYEQIKHRPLEGDLRELWGGAPWFYWYGLIHYHKFPFLKVKIARMQERGLQQVIERHTDYPYALIDSHVNRISGLSWFTHRGDPRIAVDPQSL